MAHLEPDPATGYFDFVVSAPSSADCSPSADSVTTLTEAHLVDNNIYSVSDKARASALGSTNSVDSAATFAAAEPETPPAKSELKPKQPETEPEAESQTDSQSSAPFTPPDGGLVAWCQVVAGFLLNAIAWGTLSMFGVYQLYYTQNLGMPVSGISWVGSIQTFLTYLLSTVSGQLTDVGYGIHTTIAGTVCVIAGTIWNSFAVGSQSTTAADVVSPSPIPISLYLSQAVLTGIGLGLLSAASVPAINAYFSRRKSLALSISTMGTSFGGAMFPAVVQFLLPVIGFGWAMRVTALIELVFCVVALLVLRPGKPKKTATGAKPKTKTTPMSVLSACGAYLRSLIDWTAFRQTTFVLFLLAAFFIYWAIYFGFYYVNVYAEDVVGFSRSNATTLLIITTIVGLPARPLVGFLADNLGFGCFDTVVASCIFTAGTLLGWMAVGRSTAGMYTFAILFGLGNGAIQGIWLGVLALLSAPKEDSEDNSSRIGVRFGMFCTVSAFATLAGPPTASALLSTSNGGDTSLPGTYMTAQIWAGATILVGAAVLFATRVKFVGWKLFARV